jgi:hypothetical protein
VIPGLFRRLRDGLSRRKGGMESLFTKAYSIKKKGDRESISGVGSYLKSTIAVRAELPGLLREIETKSLLDAPCGDFNWMSKVHIGDIKYIGVDIVADLIEHNQEHFSSENRTFLHRNIATDPLPRADVILCRDCLVHLSFADISAVLHNFQASGSGYLLTTTFVNRHENLDIRTGEWRPLNLEVEPFNFSKPIRLINEYCADSHGQYKDKHLGLWKLADMIKA